MLFVRPRESSDGLLMSFPFELGAGLRDRCRVPRRIEESSDAVVKCFDELGMGGTRLGELEERPYLDVFRRISLGGERLPGGVETGEARWNSASSARERTRLSGGLVEGVSFGGEDSRVIGSDSGTSGCLVERFQIMIVPSAPVLMRIFWSLFSRRATPVTLPVWPHSLS